MATNRLLHIVEVEWIADHRLRLRFSDGTEGEHDFSDLVARSGPMVVPLRDVDLFSRVFLEDGALTWPNGFDIDSTALHMRMEKAGELHRPEAAE